MGSKICPGLALACSHLCSEPAAGNRPIKWSLATLRCLKQSMVKARQEYHASLYYLWLNSLKLSWFWVGGWPGLSSVASSFCHLFAWPTSREQSFLPSSSQPATLKNSSAVQIFSALIWNVARRWCLYPDSACAYTASVYRKCQKTISITTASELVCVVQSTERIALLHLTVVTVLEPALILFVRFEWNQHLHRWNKLSH